MDRKALLDDLAMRLRKAADSSNWRDLKAADRDLAAFLLKMNERHTWTKPEWAAFQSLKRTHALVREHCRREAALYATRIAGMRKTKIGWMAYAMQGRNGGEGA
jgi:hypothetical protein